VQFVQGNQVSVATAGSSKPQRFKWHGWPSGTGGPAQIALTEGGARLKTKPDVNSKNQGEKVTNEFRWVKKIGSVALFSNFLVYPDPGVTTNRAYLINRTITHNGNAQFLDDITPAAGEPTATEFRKTARPVYGAWAKLYTSE
jgi:hypothetical protein